MLADSTCSISAPIAPASDSALVTVVLPCFNHEKFVEQAICSVFKQTYANIELIVIDDCSSDNSVTVIQNLQQQYNFQFIQNKVNKGVQANLQDIVINHALGEYVKVLDADDYLLPEGIELLVSGFNGLDDSYGFVFGDYYEMFADINCFNVSAYGGRRGCPNNCGRLCNSLGNQNGYTNRLSNV